MPDPRTIACATALLASSCAPAAIDGGFESPNPAATIYAIEQAARSGDTTATPQIVEQLDSDDPAVRLLAIEALEILTGETYGYRYDEPQYMRRAAIKRWVNAVESGTVPIPSARPRVDDG